MMPSVVEITYSPWCRIVEWLVSIELGRMSKEAAMDRFEVGPLSLYFSGRTVGDNEKS
jgi:hypothetical protein